MELQPESIPRGNERILLVDDDETIVISAQNMLQRFGYKVTAFTDGQEALMVFKGIHPWYPFLIFFFILRHNPVIGSEEMLQ